MATVLDAIRRLEQFEKELINAMPTISVQVTSKFLVAKIQQIRKVGIGQYSTKTYSASFLKGKELNAAGKSFIENKRKAKQKTNWKEFRMAQGLQGSFVDVSYSGQMLNSTGIQKNNRVSYIYYSTIGGRNAEAKMKLEANRKRYGDFLRPTPEQEKAIGKHSIDLIGNIYKRILLN